MVRTEAAGSRVSRLIRGVARREGVADWRLLVDPPRSARAQMARDAQLAEEARPTVRWFTWDPPAVSLGLKQEPPAWLRAPAWRRSGLDRVVRPTGGGIAFHGSDVSVAVAVPRALGVPLDALMGAVCGSAARVCGQAGVTAHPVLQAPGAGRITYCLAEPSPYAVMAGGKKVAGFALRRLEASWLVQGSVLVRPLPERLMAALPAELVAELRARAVSLTDAAGSPVAERDIVSRWRAAWAAWWDESVTAALAERG